jgi:hypothetical protein
MLSRRFNAHKGRRVWLRSRTLVMLPSLSCGARGSPRAEHRGQIECESARAARYPCNLSPTSCQEPAKATRPHEAQVAIDVYEKPVALRPFCWTSTSLKHLPNESGRAQERHRVRLVIKDSSSPNTVRTGAKCPSRDLDRKRVDWWDTRTSTDGVLLRPPYPFKVEGRLRMAAGTVKRRNKGSATRADV